MLFCLPRNAVLQLVGSSSSFPLFTLQAVLLGLYHDCHFPFRWVRDGVCVCVWVCIGISISIAKSVVCVVCGGGVSGPPFHDRSLTPDGEARRRPCK